MYKKMIKDLYTEDFKTFEELQAEVEKILWKSDKMEIQKAILHIIAKPLKNTMQVTMQKRK